MKIGNYKFKFYLKNIGMRNREWKNHILCGYIGIKNYLKKLCLPLRVPPHPELKKTYI